MSSTTTNLGLFKYDTATDGKQVFSIETALNDNWDLIDSLVVLKSELPDISKLVTTNTSQTVTAAKTFSGTVTCSGTIKVPASSTTGTALQLSAQSVALNGYIKFGSGLELQWLRVSRSGNDTTFTFPHAFGSIKHVQVTHYDATAGGDACVKSISGTGGTIRCTAADYLYIFAIGASS